jgi:hypothetical protein
MSVRSRIERLEQATATAAPPATVVRVRVIVVHSREEVQQLRAAGLLDSCRDNGRPIPRGPVRVVIEEAVDAKDLLVKARAVSTQDEGQADSDARES